MAASTVVPLTQKQQASFIQYYSTIQGKQNVNRDNSRSRLERIDKQYQREVDETSEQRKAKAANRAGDTTKMQNIVVPVVMPQVEAAVVHQSSVFLTGVPIFGVVASPTFMDEAIQMETVLDNNSTRGGWAREFMLGFRDGFKFNLGYFEVSWGQEVTYTVDTDVAKSLSAGQPKKVIWTGNKVKRLDPYNTFVDTRVPLAELYKSGEFAGYTEYKSRIELKKFISELPDKITGAIVPAFESGATGLRGANVAGAMNFYVPNVNSDITAPEVGTESTDWLSWANLDTKSGNKIAYKEGYDVTTLYCRVLPDEFGLKVTNAKTPQIYKLIIVNHAHIIYAELQTNAHNYLPILGIQPQEDGLNYQTKSLADNAEPFQQVATTLMGAMIASKRRAIGDRVLYDPSRITSAVINSPNPSAKMPVRPSAQGGKLSDAVYHFPYKDDQASSSFQQIQATIGLANTLNGQNQAQQGQFVKGNRTLQEFESVMDNANGRDQLVSILLEHQLFVPLKHILKLNVLQFQGGTTVYNRDKDRAVEIDPIALRKAVMEFKVSDGLVPSSKILNSETFSTAIQVIGSSPQIGAGYNLAPMFSYFMKTQGAKITEFEKSTEQVAFEGAMQQWSGLAQLAIEKGVEFKQPQPLPEQYGYEPKTNKPAPKSADDNSTQNNPQGTI